MSQQKTLGFLTLTALIVLAAWVTLKSDRESLQGDKFTDLMVPNLAQHLDEADHIKISSVSATTTLRLTPEGSWNVVERNNYPADTQLIRQTIQRLAKSNKLEEKTSNPDLYEKLGLDEENATRILITAGKFQIIDLFIGNAMRQLDGTYAREASQEQSWVMSGNFKLGASPSEWLDKELLNIERKRIKSVTITQTDGKKLELIKNSDEDKNFTLLNKIPNGHKLIAQYHVDDLAIALENLKLQDVKPITDFPKEKKPAVTAVLTTFDDITISARVLDHEDQKYVTFMVDGDDSLKQKVTDWAYQLSDHKISQLTKKLSDLIEEEKEDEPDNG